MQFDFNKLKELNELDFDQIAIWPFEVKTVVALFVAIIALIGGYYTLVKDKLPMLEKAQLQEVDLKQSYQGKYNIAVNLPAYQDQLERLENDFSSMLKSLPTSNETPGLLDDITFVGTSSGLTFKLLNWQKEVPKEFYTELPIQIEVTGNYHAFGQFVSDIAALPRIVTVHDFEVTQELSTLKLKLAAKTYRAELTQSRKDSSQ
ncbi:MAG: pilus assembly protein PilP [Alteromonadaceae bacterium]|jgi:type IV pilus assembly protein PilO|uniref:Pilus assembly protein PilO n=2 Tax=Paraglaciecola chathamensis TaxID=368405 RepID=A0A8H9LZW7_9ALTE|nr:MULTISPECIES: type 4a pilus biogenesis protein PilO [Paraglaciecola]AEE21698.1 pilus assembly protein, PilO [Glaciecola sp. 4H-3-7+YE-5]MBN24242.1 pilus assembly protein PilP [Alteromonadaceae bacterium]GAC04544.1 type IV pilus assembly protein PilO [Paraglaciecola agarilytica NO2]GGZ53606.1 pilus assembly protein PilO [Paraglaciecola oceanifecundans]|tara:strand:- start:71720 stop:72331 length:612 start_codon:yes stop_codon:yes gene_type:complete